MVDVLIPSYNHAPWIEAAIRSVLAQEDVDVRLLVLDDGSRDESPQLLTRLAQELGFELILRENRGVTSTLIELAGRVRAPYFCSLGSDDIMPPGRLRAQLRELQSHPESPGCAGQVIVMDAEGNLEAAPLSRFQRGIPQVDFESLLLGKLELHGASVLLRTEHFRAVGGYRPDIGIEDYPLWLALTHRFGAVRVIPDVACHYRIHGNNLHQRVDFMYEQIFKSLESYRDHALFPLALRRWKANWWSELAFSDKRSALKRIFALGSLDFIFIRRLPKLFIPSRCLRW